MAFQYAKMPLSSNPCITEITHGLQGWRPLKRQMGPHTDVWLHTKIRARVLGWTLALSVMHIPDELAALFLLLLFFYYRLLRHKGSTKKTYTKHWNHISEPHLLPWQRERRQINGRISWPATGTRSRVIVHRQWVTEWVEFNAPPHTILVISQAESVQPAINNKLTSKPTP